METERKQYADRELRKFCVEQAQKTGYMGDGDYRDGIIATAQAFYDFITNSSEGK
jgi:hypothetical protein